MPHTLTDLTAGGIISLLVGVYLPRVTSAPSRAASFTVPQCWSPQAKTKRADWAVHVMNWRSVILHHDEPHLSPGRLLEAPPSSCSWAELFSGRSSGSRSSETAEALPVLHAVFSLRFSFWLEEMTRQKRR